MDEDVSRQDAKDMYCELHETNTEDVVDEDFFVDPISFKLLPNVSDVAAGRDVQPPTSKKNKPKKSNPRTLKRVVASFRRAVLLFT